MRPSQSFRQKSVTFSLIFFGVISNKSNTETHLCLILGFTKKWPSQEGVWTLALAASSNSDYPNFSTSSNTLSPFGQDQPPPPTLGWLHHTITEYLLF